MDTGFSLRDRHTGINLVGFVIVDIAMLIEHATVTVIGEFVQAGISHHDEIVAYFGDHFPNGHVEDAVRVDAGGTTSVERCWYPEQHDASDAGLDRVVGCGFERVHTVLLHTGHRGNVDRLIGALIDEDHQGQVGGRTTDLCDQAAHGGRLAQAARTMRKHDVLS